MPSIIQVFEHESLRVGDDRDGVRFEARHFEALSRLIRQSQRALYAVGRESVRFSSYVGILQAGDLTIEVLPKVDRPGAAARRGTWQRVLVDLLRYCRLLPLHPLPAAGQGLRPHSLLDWYVGLFLVEVEDLVRRGLIRTYRREQGSGRALRGRLLPGRQIQYNAARIDRFFTDREIYDHGHLFNAILWAALQSLSTFHLSPDLEDRIHHLMICFPDGVRAPDNIPDWEQLRFDRKTERYRLPLQMAWMLVRQVQPNLRAGRYSAAALLFDMNLLFEEFVYRQLQPFAGKAGSIRRQVRRPFWNRRHIRPDILLRAGKRSVVLDTKWKQLSSSDPPMEDLQQLYIYQHAFQAEDGVLLYPQPGGLSDHPAHPFHPGDAAAEAFQCRVLFVDVLDANGSLNRELGRSLFERILNDNH